MERLRSESDLQSFTELMRYAILGNVAGVRGRIAAGDDLTKQDNNGITALMHSLQYKECRKLIIKAMLDAGKSLDQKTVEPGATALMLAAKDGNFQAFEELLEAGADALMLDNNQVGILNYAVMGKNTAIMGLVIDEYRKRNIRVDQKDVTGCTAVNLAYYNQLVDIAEELIALGADINNTDNNGLSSLMVAVQQNHYSVIHHIIANGGKVDLQDLKGMTALMFAAGKGHVEIVKELLAGGADPLIKTKAKGGKSALDFAKEKGHKEVADIIAQHCIIDKLKFPNGRSSQAASAEEILKKAAGEIAHLLNQFDHSMLGDSKATKAEIKTRGALLQFAAIAASLKEDEMAEFSAKHYDRLKDLSVGFEGRKILQDEGVSKNAKLLFKEINKIYGKKSEDELLGITDSGVDNKKSSKKKGGKGIVGKPLTEKQLEQIAGLDLLGAVRANDDLVVAEVLKNLEGECHKEIKERALQMTARMGGNFKIMELLLKDGVYPDCTINEYGNTPLIFLAMHGDIKGGKLLLDYNASLYQTNNKDSSAITIANLHGYEDWVKEIKITTEAEKSLTKTLCSVKKVEEVGRVTILYK